jgi:hypothetical protein
LAQDEDLYEEDPKISEMVDRYNTLSSTLTDNAAKAETLCAWCHFYIPFFIFVNDATEK